MAIIFKVFSHSFLHGHMFFPHEFSLKSTRILPIIVTVVKVLCKYKLSLVVCKKNDMPAVLFQNDTDMPFSNFSSLEPNPDHTDNVIELCRFRSVFFLFHLRGNKSKLFANLCDNLRIDGSEHFFHFCKTLGVAAFHTDEESALYLADIDHFQFLAAP